MKEFVANVFGNRVLSETSFVLELEGCEALSSSEPGQFVMVRGDWGRDPLLPRAFSILRTKPNGRAEILVKAMGKGTRLLQLTKIGAALKILGPLGRPFPAPDRTRMDLLVAGGVGVAPLLWHAERARAMGVEVHLFYGARTKADLVLLDEIERVCSVSVSTEDGSLVGTQALPAFKGRVTEALTPRLKDLRGQELILTCGPNPMMRAVAELGRAHGVRSLVSVEGEMACGIGACLGCAIPLVNEARPFAYACCDGPVFESERIVIP